MKTVEEIMKPYPVSCELNDTVNVAVKKMSQSDADFLPVVDKDQRVVGMVKQADITRIMSSTASDANKLTVNQIMNPGSFAINAHEDEATAYSTMKSERINRLPVVDDENHLKGSITFMSIARRIVNFKKTLKNMNKGRQNSRPNSI
ncbi:MAG: CBS domain-containing protein [bacterium]|nr:CBS domain-containing protein [bacterium]